MSGYNVIRSDKGQKGYCRVHNIHTKSHPAEEQFGAETWGTVKVERRTRIR
jgi:hypothetical protein